MKAAFGLRAGFLATEDFLAIVTFVIELMLPNAMIF
jgi:hypothetical protein